MSRMVAKSFAAFASCASASRSGSAGRCSTGFDFHQHAHDFAQRPAAARRHLLGDGAQPLAAGQAQALAHPFQRVAAVDARARGAPARPRAYCSPIARACSENARRLRHHRIDRAPEVRALVDEEQHDEQRQLQHRGREPAALHAGHRAGRHQAGQLAGELQRRPARAQQLDQQARVVADQQRRVGQQAIVRQHDRAAAAFVRALDGVQRLAAHQDRGRGRPRPARSCGAGRRRSPGGRRAPTRPGAAGGCPAPRGPPACRAPAPGATSAAARRVSTSWPARAACRRRS